jgi:hypothetical protein
MERSIRGSDMAQNDTLIVRVAIEPKGTIYRDIEIEGSKSLYRLAEAITSAFGFNFDHAFGFYSGLKPVTMMGTAQDMNCSSTWAMPIPAFSA